MIRKLTAALVILALVAPASWSQSAPKPGVKIEDLSWMDRNFFAQQRQRMAQLAGENLGARFTGQKSDLQTLQRIIDRGLVKQDETLMQQAMGVILGDIMLEREPELAWKVYEDKKGRSRALCAPDTQECLFPITMLSRRMRVGIEPDVSRIYLKAMNLIAPHLPELPYGGERNYSAP